MPAPPQEPEPVPAQPRRDVSRHQRRLDGQGARSAHGIDELPALPRDGRPAGAQQNGRRQVFLEWGQAAIDPITALMQAVTGQIDAHGRLIVMQVNIDAQIGPD